MPKTLVNLDGELVCIRDYCKIKGISYSAVISRKSKTNLSYEEILKDYEKTGNKKILTVSIDGITYKLKDYCVDHDLNYKAVTIYKYKHPNMSYQEIIKLYENGDISAHNI